MQNQKYKIQNSLCKKYIHKYIKKYNVLITETVNALIIYYCNYNCVKLINDSYTEFTFVLFISFFHFN